MRALVVLLLVALMGLGLARWKSPSTTAGAAVAAPEAETNDTLAVGSTGAAPPAVRGLSRPLPLNEAEAQAQLQAMREEGQRSAERVAAAGRNQLVGRYEQEATDHTWATAKQTELASFGTSDQIEAIQARPDNLDIACRSSVCRIGADFLTRSAAEDWAALFLTGAGARLPTAALETSVNPDGSIHLDIYGSARR